MPSIFKNIDTVTVNGSNKYLGGYIYDVNFKPSIGQEAATLTVSLVSEDGRYANPILTVKQPSQIRIGNLSLNMYPIKYTKKDSPQGKILEVEFTDGSFYLDKIYVGLIKKHWNVPRGNFYQRFTINKNFIILGRELHPCDTDKDGRLSPQEIRDSDPCDPCPSCPPEKLNKQTKCDELSFQKIFDVAYNFYEFLDGLAAMGKFSVQKPQIPESQIKQYIRDYTGTARTVLDSWCSDLALSYVYDSSSNLLFFKDISNDLKVNESAIKNLVESASTKVISKEIEESMENTLSHGSLSLYERDGQLKSYNCTKSQSLVLPIITDFDFLGERKRTTADKKLDSLLDTVGAILGNYSESLRESFWLRKIYGVNNPKSARKMVEKLELGKGSQERGSGYFEKISKKMPELGNMIIIGVIEDPAKAAGSLEEEEKLINQQYNTLVNNMSNDIERNQFLKDKGFFLIAYHEKDNYEKRLQTEQQLFEALGRFYVREGYVKLCGITGSPEEIIRNTEINAGDGGNANFYSRGFELSNLPIAKYPYEPNGYVSCLLAPSVAKADSTKNPPKSIFENLETKTTDNASYYGPTILTIEREPVWDPDPKKLEGYKELLDKFQGFMLKEYGNDGRGYVPTSAYPESIQEILKTNVSSVVSPAGDILPGNIRIYTMIPQDSLNINWVWNVEHPTEKLGKEIKENKQRKDPTTIPGLISKKTFKISIDDTFAIYAPPLSIQENLKPGNQSDDNPCDDFVKDRKPAYRVILNQSYNVSKEIPKIQSVQENLPNVFSEDTMKFELNYLNITDSDFRVLGATCTPNNLVLKEIHNKFNVRQTSSVLERFKKIKYQLKGIPNIDLKTALDLGLDELNFSYAADGGVCNISFSNSYAKTPSLDAIRAGIAYNKIQHYSSSSSAKESSI
jgi:hypothetical protein